MHTPTAGRSHEAEQTATAAANARADSRATPRHVPVTTVSHRLHMILPHCSRLSFESQARLARAAGVSRSTISRIMRGARNPSFSLARRITDALAGDLGVPLDVADVFSLDGTYSEPSACRLCGCDGCIPAAAFDARGHLRPAYRSMRPGDWSISPAGPLPAHAATPAN